VFVDAAGAVKRPANAGETARLSALRRDAARTATKGGPRTTSSLRKISLTRLERELQLRRTLRQPVDEEMRTLAGLQVPATFFLIGKQVTPFRETVALEARGNAVGNHTFHHTQLTAVSLVDAGHEIADTSKAITAITHQPVRLLRPPLGSRNPGVDAVARAEGVLEVHWDIDVHDIEGANAQKVLAAINHQAKPGSIILMHENAPQTLGSLGAIVAAVRARHLRPVTVPQLMALDPPSPQQLAAGPRGCGLRDPEAAG